MTGPGALVGDEVGDGAASPVTAATTGSTTGASASSTGAATVSSGGSGAGSGTGTGSTCAEAAGASAASGRHSAPAPARASSDERTVEREQLVVIRGLLVVPPLGGAAGPVPVQRATCPDGTAPNGCLGQDVPVSGDSTTVIRPSAVLRERTARAVVAELERRDVSQGGVWSASPGLWQRYDKPWDGPGGTRGTARLVGSIAAVYGSPSKYDITIYRVTTNEDGRAAGWSVESLCDDALQYADLTLATCPRADLTAPPRPDPFRPR